MKIAVIDLGSNSFHMVIFAVSNTGKCRIVDHLSQVNTLGAWLVRNEAMPAGEIKKNVAGIAAFCARARRENVQRIAVFGTSIFRSMPAREQFIDAIFKKTGLLVDVLSEKDEITAIYEAVKHYHGFQQQTLIIDIGGGSSEFIYVKDKKIKWSRSVPMGTARAIELIQTRSSRDAGRIRKRILSSYEPIISYLRKKQIDTCYGTCGFLRLIALRLHQKWLRAQADRAHVPVLSCAQIAVQSKTSPRSVQRSPKEQDIVAAGSMLVLHCMRQLRIKEVNVLAVSTREGYLLRILKKKGLCHN